MTILSYRDLRVWQLGMKLVSDVHRLTGTFPPSASPSFVADMHRAVIAIPSKIAEGHARAQTVEYLTNVAMAHGSLAELQTQLEIAVRLGYISSSAIAGLTSETLSLERQLKSLRTALKTLVERQTQAAENDV